MLGREIANVDTKKTVMTYLPPINASVNEFSIIFGFLTYMQKLCKEVNMPYVNITLDLGAAMPAIKWYSTIQIPSAMLSSMLATFIL